MTVSGSYLAADSADVVASGYSIAGRSNMTAGSITFVTSTRVLVQTPTSPTTPGSGPVVIESVQFGVATSTLSFTFSNCM